MNLLRSITLISLATSSSASTPCCWKRSAMICQVSTKSGKRTGKSIALMERRVCSMPMTSWTRRKKKAFNKLKLKASEREIYRTYLELASFKELACIFMKTVDDDCVAFKKPRLMDPDWKPPGSKDEE